MGLERHCILAFGRRPRGPAIRHTSPLQMAMNAIGPQRCMSDLARSTRATLRVHLCACGMPNAAAQQLPEVFYGIRAGAARIECEDVGDPMSLARITLTVAGDCWITSEIPDDDPQPAHHTSSGRVSSRSASTCLAVEAFTGLSAAGCLLRARRSSSPTSLCSRRLHCMPARRRSG